jgi:hypothetical protein
MSINIYNNDTSETEVNINIGVNEESEKFYKNKKGSILRLPVS